MSNLFNYHNDLLEFDGISLSELAQKYPTPLYIYSATAIQKQIESYKKGAQNRRHLLCYAVKANSNLSVLQIAARAGCGADIVSSGELYRCQLAGIESSQIVYSGVGKTRSEIEAALRANILLFSVESAQELQLIDQVATNMGIEAQISLRVNPDVDAGTHPYISTGLSENKFGIEHSNINSLIKQSKSMSGIRIAGIGFHIGSQLTRLDAYQAAAEKIRQLVHELENEGCQLDYIDCGGGLGIQYDDENPPTPEKYVELMCQELPFSDKTLIFEPGRSIVANAGILLSQVLYTKQNKDKRFIICNAAMNDLIRPALYDGYHRIYSVKESHQQELIQADLVGPICESGDFLARNRSLPYLKSGDLLAIASAGAYGFVMASNYNSRPRAAELLITPDKKIHLARQAESYADLVRGEKLLHD